MGKLGVKIPRGAFKKGKQEFDEGGDFPEDVELEPGRYVGILDKLDFVDTSNGAQAVFRATIAGESEQAGGRVSLWFNLDPERIVWLFRVLAKLGFDVDDLDEDQLAEIAEEIETDPLVVRISAKRKGDYVNLGIDKVLEELSVAEAKGATPSKESDEGEDDEEDDDEEEEDDGDGLDDKDRNQLKSILKSNGIDFAVKKSTTDDQIREAIRAHLTSEDDEEEEEDDEEEDDDDAIDLASMDREALKKLSQDRKLGIRFTKGKSDNDIRAMIAEKLGIDQGEDDDEEEEEDDPDDDVELSVGDVVVATIRGTEIDNCKVVDIDEENGKVKVKRGDNGKTATVSADNIAV